MLGPRGGHQQAPPPRFSPRSPWVHFVLGPGAPRQAWGRGVLQASPASSLHALRGPQTGRTSSLGFSGGWVPGSGCPCEGLQGGGPEAGALEVWVSRTACG